MKTTISDNGNYKLSVEVSQVKTDGNYCVRFVSDFLGSKNPDQSQTKFEMFLTEDQLKKFRNSLVLE